MRSRRPAVSVIIPAFNAASFLETAVTSVLTQTYGDFEVVIVDDGSHDQTAQIAAHMAICDPRVVLYSTPNRGVAHARNYGVALSRGALVAFLDADDWWSPRKLERQLALMALEPHLAATGTYATYALAPGRTVGALDIGPVNDEQCRRFRRRRKPVWLLTPSVVCRRDVFDSSGGFDSSFGGAAEDLDLWTRIAEQHAVRVLAERLVYVRVSGASVSMTRYFVIQRNTLRVRENTRRRATGEPVLDAHAFEQWYGGLPPQELSRLERTWKSGYYYRHAGHAYLAGRPVVGATKLLMAALLAPRVTFARLRRQVFRPLKRPGEQAGLG